VPRQILSTSTLSALLIFNHFLNVIVMLFHKDSHQFINRIKHYAPRTKLSIEISPVCLNRRLTPTLKRHISLGKTHLLSPDLGIPADGFLDFTMWEHNQIQVYHNTYI
jgi:hypothetical protein